MDVVKKTRGRKKKEIQVVNVEPKEPKESSQELDVKRRGRKPKGGKLIQKINIQTENTVNVSNIILHLRCSLKDLNEYTEKQNEHMIAKNPLEYNPSVPPEIMAYDGSVHQSFAIYQKAAVSEKNIAYMDSKALCMKCKSATTDTICEDEDEEMNEINTKELNTNLKKLRIQFYKNALSDKKSACFWCTYEFDNPPCFIPKYEMNDEIVGYGSFCRPECAVGFLMRESIDDSSKFERYFLLNQIYSKVYGFRKNIKPAPDPHFFLEKFYGNLTIQEYRRLLKTENMLTIMEKPMTRILPEIHEDNDEFLLNVYGGVKTANTANTGGVYKVKRQSEKQQGPNKMAIMRDKFGV